MIPFRFVIVSNGYRTHPTTGPRGAKCGRCIVEPLYYLHQWPCYNECSDVADYIVTL